MLKRRMINDLFVSHQRKFLFNSVYSRLLENRNIIRRKHTNGNPISMNPPWRIMFFGSDNFAVKSLEYLCSKLRTNTLISMLDVSTSTALDWKNNKNSVYQFAESEKLTIHNWPIDVSIIRNKYDIGIVVSFGYLIPAKIIESFPLGIFNVHGSLLPRWRGAAPIIHAILNGDSETGVTIMKINPHKFDTGDIVRQYKVAVKSHETAVELTDRLAIIGARLLMECVRNLPRSALVTVPQSNEGISYAPKITSSMTLVDWKNKSAQQVYNQHRALSHVSPLKTYWLDSPVKLLDISLDELTNYNPGNRRNMEKLQITDEIFPGLVEFSGKRSVLRIQCKDGLWICVQKVIASQKTLSPKEFYNGYLSKIKATLDRRFTYDKNRKNS